MGVENRCLQGITLARIQIRKDKIRIVYVQNNEMKLNNVFLSFFFNLLYVEKNSSLKIFDEFIRGWVSFEKFGSRRWVD